jgi:hypothetical protein
MDITTSPSANRRPAVSGTRRMVVSVVAAGLVLMGLVQAKAAFASQDPAAGFQARHTSVRIVDAHGAVVGTTSRLVDVPAAYPGMPAWSFDLHLKNTGSDPARFSLGAKDVVRSGARTMERQLVVTIKGRGRVLYRGRLSDLHVSDGVSVASGSSVTYSVEIAWPDRGGDDNGFQGAAISFTIAATALALD